MSNLSTCLDQAKGEKLLVYAHILLQQDRKGQKTIHLATIHKPLMSRRFDDRDNDDDNNNGYCDANDDAHLIRAVNSGFTAMGSPLHTPSYPSTLNPGQVPSVPWPKKVDKSSCLPHIL